MDAQQNVLCNCIVDKITDTSKEHSILIIYITIININYVIYNITYIYHVTNYSMIIIITTVIIITLFNNYICKPLKIDRSREICACAT